MKTAYLGLGSNVGDRDENLRAAIERLRAVVQVLRISPVYETDPVEFTEQRRFLNLVPRTGRTIIGIDSDEARRLVDGARGDVAVEPRLSFLENRAAVGAIGQPDDRQEHRLFERTEHIRHVDYIVVIEARVKSPLARRLECK